MFKVVKDLQRQKEKRKLLIDGEIRKTTEDKTQVETVTRFLNSMFSREEIIENRRDTAVQNENTIQC